MRLLEERIVKDGTVASGDVLRVDSFLNHQIDVPFLDKLAEEFVRRFEGEEVDKIFTVEASGIAIAALVALRMGKPLVFAKKAKTSNIDDSFYVADCFSYTHGVLGRVMVSKNYVRKGERILIIDDFLANGQASLALLGLVRQAEAVPVGIGIMVEKSYQPGRALLEAAGIRVESLARVASMDPEKGITFVEE